LKTPEFLGVETSRDVEFSGYVTDPSGIEKVIVDGEEADLVYDEEKDRYDFSLTVSHDNDGYIFHHVKAVDKAGNVAEIGRRFFIDSEKASLKVKADKETTKDQVKVDVSITDNFDDIRLYVNGDEVYKHDLSEPFGMHGF